MPGDLTDSSDDKTVVTDPLHQRLVAFKDGLETRGAGYAIDGQQAAHMKTPATAAREDEIEGVLDHLIRMEHGTHESTTKPTSPAATTKSKSLVILVRDHMAVVAMAK